jgi:hypothetical protein
VRHLRIHPTIFHCVELPTRRLHHRHYPRPSRKPVRESKEGQDLQRAVVRGADAGWMEVLETTEKTIPRR